MQKQVFTGLIYTEFYTPCQHFRNLVSSWEVGKTTCVKQVVKKKKNSGKKFGCVAQLNVLVDYITRLCVCTRPLTR